MQGMQCDSRDNPQPQPCVHFVWLNMGQCVGQVWGAAKHLTRSALLLLAVPNQSVQQCDQHCS